MPEFRLIDEDDVEGEIRKVKPVTKIVKGRKVVTKEGMSILRTYRLQRLGQKCAGCGDGIALFDRVHEVRVGYIFHADKVQEKGKRGCLK